MGLRKNVIIVVVLFVLALTACSERPANETVPQFEQQGTAHTVSTDNNKVQAHILYNRLTDKPHDTSTGRWWDTASFYYIWVRSFKDANGDGNGDLQGIKSTLTYIKSLGVRAVILSPIFESPSYHGYDVTDFKQIEQDFGDWDDLSELIEEAHELGLKVLLDVPINHVSDQHPWFHNALNYQKPYEDYFIWSDSPKPGYGKPWDKSPNPDAVWHYKPDHDNRFYYGAFDYSQPDLNYKHPDVQRYMMNFFSHLAELGIDGVRLDAVRYLVEDGPLPLQADTKETYAFLTKLNKTIKTDHPSFYFLGEALSDVSVSTTYVHPYSALDQVFDFGTNFIIQDIVHSFVPEAIENLDETVQLGTLNAHKRSIKVRLKSRIDAGASPNDFVTFVNSHDFERLTRSTSMDLQQKKLAASLMLMMPGAISLYYGEEIGILQYNLGDDAFRRAPMQWEHTLHLGFSTGKKVWIDNSDWFPWIRSFSPWWSQAVTLHSDDIVTVASQINDNQSLLRYYQSLLATRNKYAQFFNPERIEVLDSKDEIVALDYVTNNQRLRLLINLSLTDCIDVSHYLNQRKAECLKPGELIVDHEID